MRYATKYCPGCGYIRATLKHFAPNTTPPDYSEPVCNTCRALPAADLIAQVMALADRQHAAKARREEVQTNPDLPAIVDCGACWSHLPRASFNLSGRRPNGLQSTCRDCALIRRLLAKSGCDKDWPGIRDQMRAINRPGTILAPPVEPPTLPTLSAEIPSD